MQNKNPNITSVESEAMWESAVGWVMQTRETPGDVTMELALAGWLEKNPLHGEFFKEAESLWSLVDLADGRLESQHQSRLI
ncbi:hypothetical protein A9Q81_17340 [Gammaproteobacteria bacterium 42_54_T18]|nr:hypothetical protein A9Q81_17340 [Gammaproteobacteria bacterium 42_54_T18]